MAFLIKSDLLGNIFLDSAAISILSNCTGGNVLIQGKSENFWKWNTIMTPFCLAAKYV